MKLIDLEFSRLIPAAPEEVYDVWIDPSCPGGPWFSPQTEHQSSKTILDAKVDGLFYHRVTAGGQDWVHYGRLPREGGSFVTLVQTGVPDDEPGRGQRAGWQWILGALAETLAKRRSR